MKNISVDPLILIIKLSELKFDKRIDVHYYKPEYLANMEFLEKHFSLCPLQSICSLIKDGPHKTPIFVESGVPFLQKGDVTIGHINYNRPKHVSFEYHNDNQKTQTHLGDILLRKIGVGPREAAVVDEDRPLHIFVTLALIRLFPQYDPYFVEMFLNSKFGLLQTERYNKGIGSPSLHLEDIKTIMIPHISKTLQQKIIKKVSDSRIKNNRILKEIDTIKTNFLLFMQTKLGLSEIDESWDLFFTKRLPTDRLDVRHHSPIYEKLEENLSNGIFKTEILHTKATFPTDKIDPEITSSQNYFDYIQLQDIDADSNQIISFNSIIGIDLPSRAKLPLNTNDILIPSLGGSLNSIFEVPQKYAGSIGSSGFIKIKISNYEWRKFVILFLISKYGQYQMTKYLTGSIMPSISKNNLKNILIPIPNPSVLQEIVDEYIKFQIRNNSLHKEYTLTLNRSLKMLETMLI